MLVLAIIGKSVGVAVGSVVIGVVYAYLLEWWASRGEGSSKGAHRMSRSREQSEAIYTRLSRAVDVAYFDAIDQMEREAR